MHLEQTFIQRTSQLRSTVLYEDLQGQLVHKSSSSSTLSDTLPVHHDFKSVNMCIPQHLLARSGMIYKEPKWDSEGSIQKIVITMFPPLSTAMSKGWRCRAERKGGLVFALVGALKGVLVFWPIHRHQKYDSIWLMLVKAPSLTKEPSELI